MEEPSSKRRCVLKSEGKIRDTIIITPDLPDPEHYLTSWTSAKGNQRTIKPHSKDQHLPDHLKDMSDKSPAFFYELIVPDEIFQIVADCTNIFADKKMAQTKDSSRRIHQWIPTNHSEIKKFFGLIIFMGLVKLPRIEDYWSNDAILGHPFPGTIMSRDRFEILFQMLHFTVENEAYTLDQSHVITNLLDALNSNFTKHVIPAEDLFLKKGPLLICGRKDNQTNLKNGTRLLKLCVTPGYVYKVGLFIRKNIEAMNNSLSNTLMTLCNELLNKGHTLYTDDCFTSLDLARKLLDNDTHLVGFIKKNREHLPMKVTTAKLEAGCFIARESYDGITFMKLRDKKEVTLLLSTKHSTQFSTKCIANGKNIIKPQIIIDYEKAKEAVNICDEIAESSSTYALRESLKWYKKLIIDLLLNTAVVNALTLYKSVTKKNIDIVDFRKHLLMYLCQREETDIIEQRQETVTHKLSKKPGSVRQNRRTCHQCYKENTEVMGRSLAKNRSPKVVTYCETCPNKPYLCLSCFNKTHS